MADTTGPISTLPGTLHKAPDRSVCDMHPDRASVRRVQGETDSFGSEMHDVCQECLEEIKAHAANDRSGVCDWCRREANDLRNRRDMDEGMCGPIYRVCGDCTAKDNQRFQDEQDDY
jgi:hypothetical protein